MDKLTRLPGGTRILAWSNTHPLQAILSVCMGLVVLALALGLWTDSSFLQSAAGDFVGGMVAALILFGLAEVAFGFTQRRRRESEAVHVAIGVLSLELFDNRQELRRITAELERGEVDLSDPFFQPDGGVQTENWQLLIQSPLAAHLPGDLVWTIHQAYIGPQRLQRQVRQRALKAFPAKQGRFRVAQEFAPAFEKAHQGVHEAMKDLDAAYRK